MPYSYVKDGKVLDYHWKKLMDGVYAFYIGDIYLGQVFNLNRGGWSAVSKKPNDLCPIAGFKTRLKASEMLIKLAGYDFSN